jgi:hypothetical protein
LVKVLRTHTTNDDAQIDDIVRSVQLSLRQPECTTATFDIGATRRGARGGDYGGFVTAGSSVSGEQVTVRVDGEIRDSGSIEAAA